MKLHIAGVNHNDPKGKKRLEHWLQQLSETNPGPPAFIGVEYDQDQFAKIRGQRGVFRTLLQLRWPDLSVSDLNCLAAALAYEGDCHQQVLPKAEVLWLDDGRQVSESIIDEYAQKRLKIYEQFAGAKNSPSLEQLSEASWAAVDDTVNQERGYRFAQRILQRVAKDDDGWAIVIVGANHARALSGSMRHHLENAGYICEVNVLKTY